MTVLPPATDFTGAGVTEAGVKSFITDLREYLNDFFSNDSADLEAARNGIGLEGFAAKNRIINGVAPYINQRGAQTGMSTADLFVDRWGYRTIGSGVVDGNVVAFGGEDWIEVDITTADGTLAATDLYTIRHRIEANNIADFKLGTASAKIVTLSFKHAHTKTGVHCVSFTNDALNRVYIVEYTQSVSNADETSTITLTLDVTGTWATGASRGLEVRFVLAVGTDFEGTAGAWQAGGEFATSNQVNNLDSVSNFFRIRDVQLELGSEATTPDYEDYEQKLAKCQKYYRLLGKGISGLVVDANIVIVGSSIVPSMRTNGATLALTTTTPQVRRLAGTATGSSSSLASTTTDKNGFDTRIDGFSGLTAGQAIMLVTTDAISIEDEL